jgi:circadian clock protein KaiC
MQRYLEIDSRLERVMAVVKMRASEHSNQLRRFHIDDEGIKIDDRLAGRAGLLTGAPSGLEQTLGHSTVAPHER